MLNKFDKLYNESIERMKVLDSKPINVVEGVNNDITITEHHQEINYKGIENAEEKALQDCKEWFGSKYERVIKSLEDVVKSNEFSDKKQMRNRMLFMLSFGGVQGYPAQILVDKIINGDVIKTEAKDVNMIGIFDTSLKDIVK